MALFIVAAVGQTVGQTVASAGTFPGSNGKIAFAAAGYIRVINADGTGAKNLDAASPASTISEPAWNATGKKLTYRSGGSEIRSMNADGTNSKSLVGMPSFAGNPTWSADGSKVAFDGYIGGPAQENRIYTVPAAGGAATELVALDAMDPSYSPDGTKIAYEESAGDSDIGVMNADGSGAANITTGTGGNNSDHDPSWSPDGTKIAFTRGKQIWTMGAAGSGAIQLTTGVDAEHPTWSPDGTKIAFQRDDDIWVMDSDGTDGVNITNTPDVEDRAPDWGMGGALPPSTGIGFSASTYEGSEDGGSARSLLGAAITVVRTGNTSGTAAVSFATSDGSAKSSSIRECRACNVPPPDYLKASGTLVFADGETTKSFRVPITDDGAVENDETVNLTLRAAKGGAPPGPLTTAVLTIHDNDPNISFARAASNQSEAVGSPRLSVLLSSPVSGASVAYSVTGGTATAGEDFTLAAGTFEFGARGTSSIPLRVLDDDLKEQPETVIVELSAPTNAELGPIAVHTYTIKDDDPQGDVAGDTPASALAVDLVEQPRQVIKESLSPANSDVDVYRVHLEVGDDLAIDVDPAGSFDFFGNVIPGLQSSTVTILGTDGTTELAVVGGSEEPDGSGPTDNPAHLFNAETAGDYYLRLASPQSGEKRGYRIELHRLALAEGQDPAVLDDAGPMFAWLRGDTLGITGPTGYGFALQGAWTKVTTADRRAGTSTSVYTLAAGENVTVRSVIGDLSVPVVEDIRFSTTANRWGDVFGRVAGSSIPVRIGVPIGEFASEASDVFGFFFQTGTGAEIDDWKILLGSDITGSTLGQARNIGQVTPGAPYFLSLAKQPFKIKFGPIDTEKVADRTGTVLILDPADPFFYINFEDDGTTFVVALSAQGLIPFHPLLPPKRSAGVGLTDFYSHSSVVAGGIPLLDLFKGAKLLLDVGEAVDFDANDDGSWLGGNGNADQLFRGDLAAIGDVMRDINIGINGKVTLALGQGPLGLDVPIGSASAVYNGLEEAIWFRGTKGVANPFAGTPFSFLRMTSEDEFEGSIFSDGRFDVTMGTRFEAGPADFEIELRLDNDEIAADVDGDIRIEAKASIDTDVGSVSASCTATAGAHGDLSFSYSNELHMSGSLALDGKVTCKAPGVSVTKSINLSGSIDDGKIEFSLPLIGKKSITLF